MQDNKKYSTDVVIIGAGPTGLFSIFEAGMHKMKCHVVDTLDFIGGQCAALYPEKPIYDIPAYPKISAQDLVDKLKEQAEPFEPVYHLSQAVTEVTESDNDITVKTSKGTEISAKAIIIAAGCGAFGPNKPPLQNIEKYENKSIFYLVNNKDSFRDKKIVIAGGGDSAVDWAVTLADIAEKIYLVHRRDKFRAAPASLDLVEQKVQENKIEKIIPYQLSSLEGDGGQLIAVNVKTLKGEEKKLDADILLPFFGLSMNLGPIAQWGLNLDRNHIAVDPATLRTNHKRIFAVGDIATYNGKLKLIVNGFGEAAMACRNAYELVYPDQAFHFEYSTTSGVKER